MGEAWELLEEDRLQIPPPLDGRLQAAPSVFVFSFDGNDPRSCRPYNEVLPTNLASPRW